MAAMTGRTFALAAAAAALPSAGADLRQLELNLGRTELERRGLDDLDQRALMHFTVIFEECVGLHIDACVDIIQAEVLANPETFENRTSLAVEKMTIRTGAEGGEADYYKVGLRTNQAETTVSGVLGDGMVWYAWDWCTAVDTCYTIGPWDCDVGTPLTVEQCCNMIKASVPQADLNGNYIDCYVDPPIGSASKPVDKGRVCIHVNKQDIVVRPPRNE